MDKSIIAMILLGMIAVGGVGVYGVSDNLNETQTTPEVNDSSTGENDPGNITDNSLNTSESTMKDTGMVESNAGVEGSESKSNVSGNKAARTVVKEESDNAPRKTTKITYSDGSVEYHYESSGVMNRTRHP